MKEIKTTLIVNANVAKVLSGVETIKKSLNGIHVKGDLGREFKSQLDSVITKAETLSKLTLDPHIDGKDLKKIDSAYADLAKDLRRLETLHSKVFDGKTFKDFLPTNGQLGKVSEEIKKYESLSKSIEKATSGSEKLAEVRKKLNSKDLNILTTAENTRRKESAKASRLQKKRDTFAVDTTEYKDLDKQFLSASNAAKKANDEIENITKKLRQIAQQDAFEKVKKDLGNVNAQFLTGNSIDDFQKIFVNLNAQEMKAVEAALKNIGVNLDAIGKESKETAKNIDTLDNEFDQLAEAEKEVDRIRQAFTRFFSLGTAATFLRRTISNAIETVKELDRAMTETAVVTDFSVGDMWEALPRYTEVANQLGTTTLGAYETMTLFYQQGLKTNEVFEVGTETMKMARIAGMDYAEATNMMTAALRGFNMEIDENSAKRVNDVYSELAAITAADTQEIATAMTKTASIASNAGMEFETTAAFLSQIIETTREAPETAGTALKTVIARFQELKKDPSEIGEVDGEIVDANKIETALKTIDVALRDTSGQFRDLDDVFLDIAGKWDSLDTNTQRYIATIAAGSRQQSRFIAMMSDYDRTMELVNASNNSAGASQKQFEKTTESLESKLNKLKNAWDAFTMGIANSTLIKLGVDALTGILTIINKITGALGEGIGGFLKLGTVLLVLTKGKKPAMSIVDALSKIVATLLKGESATLAFKAGIESLTNGASAVEILNKSLLKTENILTRIKELPNTVNTGILTLKGKLTANSELGKEYRDAGAFESILKKKGIDTSKLSEGQLGNLLSDKHLLEKYIGSKGTFKVPGKTKTLNQLFKNTKLAGIFKGSKAAGALAKTLGTVSVGAAGAAAALAGLAIGAAVVYKKFFSLEARIKKAEEATENAKAAADGAKDAYDNLSSGITNLRDAQNELSGLTEGTLEFKQALLEVNQQVLNLQKEFPQLMGKAKFDESTGTMYFLEEDLDKALDEQMKAVNRANRAYSISQLNEQQLKTQQLTRKNTTQIGVYSGEQFLAKDEKEKQEYQVKIDQAKAELQAQRVTEEALSRQFFTGILNNEEVGGISELATSLEKFYSADALKELIDEKEDNIEETGDELRELYRDTFGVEAAEDLKDSEIKAMIAQAQAADEITKKAQEITNKLNKLGLGKFKDEITSAFGGAISQDQLKVLTKEYGIDKLKEADTQTELADVLGIDKDELVSFLNETEYTIADFNKAITEAAWAGDTFGKAISGLNKEETNALLGKLAGQKGNVEKGVGDFSSLTNRELSSINVDKIAKDSGVTPQSIQNTIDRAKTDKLINNFESNLQYDDDIQDDLAKEQAINKAGISQESYELLEEKIRGTNSALKEEDELVQALATDVLNLDAGMTGLIDVLDEQADALANTNSADEYYKALEKVAQSTSNLLGVKVDNEFTEKHLEKIKAAAAGSTEALEELLLLSGKEMVIDFDLPQTEINSLLSQMEGINGYDMEVGAKLDDTAFIQTLNNMLTSGKLTTAQVNGVLGQIGFEPDIDYKEVPLTVKSAGGLFEYLSKKLNGETTISIPIIKNAKAKGNTGLKKVSSSAANKTAAKSSGGGKDPWENSLDKYYNLLEDINEELRIREKLERDFAKITEDTNYNSIELLQNLKDQEASLKRQKKLQEQLLSGRKSEMKSTLKENSKYSKYATYNWDDNTIEINWSAINKIKDSDKGEAIEDYISELERIQESMDEASDAIADIDKDLKELKDTGKDEYDKLEQEVFDAYVHNIESQIDNLEDTYEAMAKANSDILDKMQESLSKTRQNRENQDIEENISETERRLAYLRQDTSGANDLEILQLEKQLEEEKEDYTDTLIDQKINELEQQNSLAELQRQTQIDLMRAQVEYAKENGLYWADIHAIMSKGINDKGVILPNSQLEKLLKEKAGYSAMSKFQKDSWKEDMGKMVELADAWLKNNTGKGISGTKTNVKASSSGTSTKKSSSSSSSSKTSSSSSGGSGSSKTSNSSSNSSNVGGSSSSSNKNNKTTSKPSSAVKSLQQLLNLLYKTGLTTDGIMGPKTGAAIKKMNSHLAGLDRFGALSGIGKPKVSEDFSLTTLSNLKGYLRNIAEGKYSIKTIQGSKLGNLYKGKTNNAKLAMETAKSILNNTAYNGINTSAKGAYKNIYDYYTKNKSKASNLFAYKTGGIADFTGPAWLDGTPSKPELILNARDTENFIQLKNVLSDLMSDSVNAGNGGDNYYEIHIEVDEIANDYDVEKLATKVKKIIASDGMYRNVNTINMLR